MTPKIDVLNALSGSPAVTNVGEPTLTVTARPKIIIVGDWAIDEDWVVGPIRSVTSSRVGKLHDRALHQPGDAVEDLCGAGRMTSILGNMKVGTQKAFDIYALGLWHPTHDEYLKGLLEPSQRASYNPFERKTFEGLKVCENVRLLNIYRYLLENKRQKIGTTRIVRIYNKLSGNTVLRQRFDWLSHSGEYEGGNEVWLKEEKEINYVLDNLNIPPDPDAIIIKDMGHGVISDAFLVKLATKFSEHDTAKKTRWYISSKYWITDRYKNFAKKARDINIELLMIPEVSAKSKILDSTIGRWTHSNGFPTYDAFILVDNLRRALGNRYDERNGATLPCGSSPRLKLIIQPDRNVLGAVDYGIQEIFTHQIENTELTNQDIPMASIYHSYLSGELIYKYYVDSDFREGYNRAAIIDILRRTLSRTLSEMANEYSKLNNYKKWNPIQNDDYALNTPDVNIDITRYWSNSSLVPDYGVTHTKTNERDWSFSKHFKLLKEAHTKLAIVELSNHLKCIQLFHATSEVEGYVSLVNSRKMAIRKLVGEIRKFVNLHESGSEELRNVSALINGSPGDGKTYLVSKIAEMFNMNKVYINITQMSTKADIFDSFLQIATEQAMSNKRPIIVVVDEINATIQNQSVYDVFLSPLEEGIYISGNHQLKLSPCAWIFCGTDKADDTRDTGKASKASDFQSRLTLRKPCTLSGLRDSGDSFKQRGSLTGVNSQTKRGEWLVTPDFRTENVYRGVSMIRQQYSDVEFVSEKVLAAFYSLPESVGNRDIKYFVRSFRDIRYGTVTSHHLPPVEEWGIILNVKNNTTVAQPEDYKMNWNRSFIVCSGDNDVDEMNPNNPELDEREGLNVAIH